MRSSPSGSGAAEKRPVTYEGRAYERVGSTTRRMPQAKYEKALLDRAHGTRRWENEPTDRLSLKDIDRAEVFRIVEAARAKGHLVEPVGSRLPGVLDRLNVRRDEQILQAAVVLFGKTFMPDYPQCELRMARFRGLDKTEFLDQRVVRGPAFKLLEEAELFCQRHFPLPGKVVSGKTAAGRHAPDSTGCHARDSGERAHSPRLLQRGWRGVPGRLRRSRGSLEHRDLP